MATRVKRSVSLPADLSEAVDQAAEAEDTTPSAWLADAARRKLIIERGIREMDEWLMENGGPATPEETAWARAIVDRIVSA